MNILKYTTIAGAALCLYASAGCSPNENLPEDGTKGPSKIAVKATPSGAWDESSINEIFALRFTGGTLQEILHPASSGEGGTYTFQPAVNDGTLHILANASGTGILSEMTPGKSTMENFLALEAATDQMTSSGLMMTGSTTLGSHAGTVEVPMKRSVARLDISTEVNGVKVLQVKVSGIADKGFAVPSGKISVPESAAREEYTKDFSTAPLQNTRKTLLYMAEQTAQGAWIEVTAHYGEGLHRFRASLPENIARNNIYTVQVHGDGTGISVTVSGEDWEDGASGGSQTQAKGLIDTENSSLPAGIRVSESRDTVYIPHLPESFTLSLLAEQSAEVSVSGNIPGVKIDISPASKSALVPAASVSVSTPLRYPGSGNENIYLDIHKEGIHTGRIVLVFKANPIQITGLLKIDKNGECDFGKYIDGELARLTLPEGRILTVEFDEGESRWMQAVQTGSADAPQYRLLGGWKPNDPKADGRTQEGRIVFSDTDGSNREEYTVRRINWGLPVTRIGESWWCKYNLRGNVKSFADQVTIAQDPFKDGDIAAGLATIPEEKLLELMGDQYQGGNPQGLPLKHDGTAFYYEGMKDSAQSFGDLDPQQMAPDGYMVPDYDDFAFFAGSDNFNLGGVGTRPFNNRTGQRLSISISERNVSFLGHEYGTIAFYDFSLDGDHWVLFGPGHQWNTAAGKIARMNLIMATCGNGIMGWSMEGYASAEKAGQNWLKYVANNSTKTRTIRCIKSPVEYIYD